MYTVVDVIDKLIDIEQMGSEIYKKIADDFPEVSSFKILALSLSKEEKRHRDYYKNLKENIKDKEDIEIDFHAYDKISKLLIEFKQSYRALNENNVQELLKFALNFEKDNLALLLNIKGRLVKSESDIKKMSYEVLCGIIKEEETHIRDIEKLMAYKK